MAGFVTELQHHINENHNSGFGEYSTVSQATEISNWEQRISDQSTEQITHTCNKCAGQFESEEDLAHHKTRVHEYGETRQPYPCEECGYRGWDKRDLNNHITSEHATIEQLVGGKQYSMVRINNKQNLNNLNLSDLDDSDDDYECSSEDDDEENNVQLTPPPVHHNSLLENSREYPFQCNVCKRKCQN